MSRCLVGLVLAVFCAVAAAGPKPPPADHPESVAEHMVGVHSPEFDHEAFLGKAEAERFDQLPPAEARRRLGILVDKIDANKDGYVTEKELEEWVRHVANRYIMDDVMRQWEHYDADKDDYVTWDEFKAATFGDHPDDNEVYDTHRKLTYKDIMKRDARRFAAADLDGDKRLTKNELADFLHPGMQNTCLSVSQSSSCLCRGCSSHARYSAGRDNGRHGQGQGWLCDGTGVCR
jgi:hypothetical protein